MQAYPKKREGICVGVLSGDRVLFQGPLDKESGGFQQKILHLSAIQTPKLDLTNNKEEKYAFAARQHLRRLLIGKKHPFVIEKKVNEIQIGYVLVDGQDVVTGLLKAGLAKIRNEKVQSEHIEEYKDAEDQARIGELGVWGVKSQKPEFRFTKDVEEKEILEKYRGDVIKGLIEDIHPSKATIYLEKDGYVGHLSFSDVQVVVLSEKTKTGESKNNARAIRSILQSSFLHREVTIHISKFCKDSLVGFLVNENKDDVRKILLENGFAKLSKEAINTLNTKEYLELKSIGQKALEEGKGLWKDQKIVKGEVINDKEYNAIVTEVHSGDSISIYNIDKKSTTRIFFPNVRSPGVNQPYSFESKQMLRKRCIGKKVRVQIEFSKKIPVKKTEGDQGELKSFIFGTVFQNQQNLSVYMLENGMVSLNPPRVEQDVTKHLEDLKMGEQKGRKERRGMHQAQHIKIPNYNDISGGKGKKIDAGKAKTFFSFLQDEPHLTGVVELVLNGSRFKVRFNQQHIMAILVLDGIRCLPNEGEYTKVSEEALQFSKMHALQRDFEVKIKRVDQKGVYHGTIIIGKRDYAMDLLESGLAVVMNKNANHKYEQIEMDARKRRVGLWSYELNLAAFKGEMDKEYKPVNFTKNLNLLEVISPEEFYLEYDGAKKPQIPQNPAPAQSVSLNEIYAVKYTDDIYYRAKVIGSRKNQYSVHFLDYGNYDKVAKGRIGILSEDLKKAKSPLIRASLYGLDGFTNQATNLLKDYYDKNLKVEMKEQADDGEYRVILWDKNKCINQEIIEYGEAENTTTNPLWAKAEEIAKKNREGKWNDD